MSKRAKDFAKEIFKDGIELFGRRDKNNNLVIHPETMVGILRNTMQRGYEQAEKVTIERVIDWLQEHSNDYIFRDNYKDKEELKISSKMFEDLRKAMEGEQ